MAPVHFTDKRTENETLSEYADLSILLLSCWLAREMAQSSRRRQQPIGGHWTFSCTRC
jgi:hypothetical protein